jgi:hypothetical protein
MSWPQGADSAWSSGAVHDTVAAIARQAAYQRSLETTLWRRFWDEFNRLVNEFFDLFRGSATGRNVTIALLVLLAVLVVARFVVAARAAREDAEPRDHRARRGGANDPWSDAERFAASGRYTEAAHALFAALLSAFAARGEVRLHASKTAGDYARELQRRGSPAQGGFQAFRRRYDGVIYGVGTCNAEEYAALLQDAQPLLVRARAA